MRDLERIRERSSDDDGHRYFMLWVVGLIVALGVVLATVASLPGTGEASEGDPLDRLLEPTPAAAPAAAPAEAKRVDPKALTFPQTLSGSSRPEVAAAIAAAAAELEYPDPLEEAPSTADLVANLPASVTAGPNRHAVEQVVDADPLVAAVANPEFRDENAPERAAAGHEGAFTLQVASYEDAQEARVFSEALRRRGHSAYVVSAEVLDRGRHWRVRIGPFDTRRGATEYRKTFEREEGMNTFVVRNR